MARRPRDRGGRARRSRHRRWRRRCRHPPRARQVRVLHLRPRRRPRAPPTRHSGWCSPADATGRCSISFALQGLLAHHSGGWFDRMRLELRRTRENPEIANAIFDGYLCPAEFMLYGSTPYAEVIAVARDLQTTARRSGALRAAAFASALIGEAALLSGDLELATAELTEANDLHRDLGSAAGEAHSLQRLAEVRVAEGDSVGGDATAAGSTPAGACVDGRQASHATHLRHDDPRRVRPARSSSHRRSRRVDARLGGRLPRSVRSCCRSRRRSPAHESVICDTHDVTWRSPKGPRCCGRARRGKQGWRRRKRWSRRPAVTLLRPWSGCSPRPNSSNRPASHSTPNGAAAPWRSTEPRAA